ncbi:MAG TPA: YggT family protein, partial [Blastocatellia bacterium]|nr:YggT family protein [Blastocatellia bacterium]
MEIVLFVLNLVATTIAVVTVAATALFVLRVIVAWLGSNPFGWVAYNLRRVTEPVVRPIRQPFSGYYMRFDLLPLVAGAMILFTGLFVADVLWRIAGILGAAHFISQHYQLT